MSMHSTSRAVANRFLTSLSACRLWLVSPAEPLLSVQRDVALRPWVTRVVLTVMLTQSMTPSTALMSAAHAKERIVVKADKATLPPPVWYLAARRQEKVRLAQVEKARNERGSVDGNRVHGSKPGHISPSDLRGCSDCEITVKALDLTRVPTEKELRMAGQLGGALSPIEEADVAKLSQKADKELKQAGIPEGIKAQSAAPGKQVQMLMERKDEIGTLEKTNLDFGEAIQEWNKHNFRHAALLFKKHIADFPGSPWRGEAELHLGCDAKYNGRFAEAQERYSDLLQATSDNPQDPSYEIHQKAKLRWADLDIAMGKFEDSQAKMANIVFTDNDWRRRTWAKHWMHNLSIYRKNARDLRACGTQALSIVFASLGRQEAARVMMRMKPANGNGFSLAELQQVAHNNGVEMSAFRATPQQLDTIPSPFLIHYDHNSMTKQERATSGTSGYKTSRSKSVNEHELTSPFRVSYSPGHFLVVRKVDAAHRRVHLFDPQEKRVYTLSYQDLSREWSGTGLAVNQGKNTLPATMHLSLSQTKKIVGGCCGIPRKQDDLGWNCINGEWVLRSCLDGCGGGSKGEPSIGINRVTLNVFVEDTPMWYSAPLGPDVSISMSYNSQDAISQNRPFGNKWMFNYGSYLVEDTATGGGVITIFMPDGRQDNYYPDGNGGYTREAGIQNTLVKQGTNSYELRFPDGSKFLYGIPTGTTSLQPFLTEIQDRWGYSLHFGYDSDVHLTTITDAQNKVTTLTYSGNHITQVKDPFERVVTFDYDVTGNMIEAVDMEGQAFQYSYDADKNVRFLTSAQGSWEIDQEGPDGIPSSPEYYPAPGTYMDQNVRLTITDPTGKKQEYFYEGAGGYEAARSMWHADRNQYVEYTPQHNNYSDTAKVVYVTGQVVDGKGKITAALYPDGNDTGGGDESIAYDTVTGLPLSHTDAHGKVTTLTYNAAGNVTSLTDRNNHTTTINYASNGFDVVGVTDADNQTQSTTTYNATHQPLSVTDAFNQNTSMTYTAWGEPATVTDAANRTTTFYYDAATKRLTSVSQSTPQGDITLASFTYDDVGRVRISTDVGGLSATYDYNGLDRVTKVTYDDGTYTSIDYVCCGLPGVIRDRSGNKSYFDYDQLKRLTRFQDSNANSLDYEYDAEGNLIGLRDGKGNFTQWAYDTVNRVTRKTYPNGTYETYSYDVPNNRVTVTDAKGQTSTAVYDDAGNLVQNVHSNAPAVAYTYDALSRVQTMTDAIGTTTYGYDLLSRLTSVDGPFANDTVEYHYDARGRRDWMRINGTDQVSYTYDALDRLNTLSSPAGTSGYVYVGNTGLLSTQTLPNGTVSNYSYDALQRLTGVTNKTSGNTLISSYVYGFTDPQHKDSRSFMERQVGANAPQHVNYGYDAADQLVSETSSELPLALLQNSFGYDAMGNRTAMQVGPIGSGSTHTFTTNTLNQLTGLSSAQGGSTTTTNYSYDFGGNLSGVTRNVDASSTTYNYDGLDRLKEIVQTNPSGVNSHKSEFFYDGASRKRLVREYSWDTTAMPNAWTLASESRRVFDGLDVIQERDGLNAVTTNYTREGNIGGLLSRSTSAGNSYYHYDGSGNVVQMTDAVQNNVAEYSYNAWGGMLGSAGSQAASNPYRYQTKEQHSASGLYDFGYRFYNGGLGRWINRDPLQEGGGINLYAAFGNDPVNSGDAYGLLSLSDTAAGWNYVLNGNPKANGPGALNVGGTLAMMKQMLRNSMGGCGGFDWQEVSAWNNRADILSLSIGSAMAAKGEMAAYRGVSEAEMMATAYRARSAAVEMWPRSPIRQEIATITAGYNSKTGLVASGFNNSPNARQLCAENAVAESLGEVSKFTAAVRPRTGKPVDICVRCEETFGRDRFPDSRFQGD